MCGSVCINHFTEHYFSRRDEKRITLKPNAIPTIFRGSFDEEIGNVDISFNSRNVCPIDVNDGNVLCPECVKKDILYATLRSENYDEKERLNTQIGEMASKIAQLKKKLH